MNCLIVDDEPLSREIIENYCSEIDWLHVIGTCTNAIQASEYLEKESVDLMFLDINMPKLTGIDFLRSLKNPPMVIFTTAYPEYAVEGFELEALDYLLKPFSFDRFFQAVQRAKSASKNSQEPSYIFLKADKKAHKIDLRKIQFVEAMGDFVKVYIQDYRTLVISSTLKNLLEELPNEEFIRIHKSFIIATRHVEFIEANRISVAGQVFPIGLAFRDQTKQVLGLHREK